MKYSEARQRLLAVRELIGYCRKKEVESFHLYYALDRNLKIFEGAEKFIVDHAPTKLKELEKRIIELGKEEETYQKQFEKGLTMLSEKETAEYKKQTEKFTKQLDEESEYKPYQIQVDKLPVMPFDEYHTYLLNFFTE